MLKSLPADEAAGNGEESLVDVVAAVSADEKATSVVKPRKGALDHPAVAARRPQPACELRPQVIVARGCCSTSRAGSSAACGSGTSSTPPITDILCGLLRVD